MKSIHTRVLSLVMAAVLVLGLLPMGAMAISYDNTTDDYYKLISKTDYELAPGIVESEIVLNNDAGTHRQVAHVVEVDIDNPYTKVIPSYKGMIPQAGNYGTQVMSQQAAWAEANGYGNVVAAMNLSLSWYNSTYYAQHPELVGEPLGYMVLDGVVYKNSAGQTSGAQTCLVINFDEKDGVARPADMPKTEIRSTSSAITGWEEQVIPANFGFLVKDGVNQYSKDHTSDPASRSFVGIKENGDIIIVMNDGRQSPYSAGFNSYEMADFMISLGCVQAVNGDGGGSSTFLSQRPGEELKLNCSPSDGAERATTHGILVISTAPATGEFVRAQITTEDKYYTPGSSIQFNAVGTDLVGTPAEIPADATWQLADESFGTIDSNGLFTSNGKTGEVTAQLIYNGQVTGEASIETVLPQISFKQQTMVLPYGETVELSLNVTTNEGRNTVTTKAGDIVFTLSDAAMGTIDGTMMTTCAADSGVTGGTITAVICGDTANAITATIKFGKASEIVYDFENNYELIIDTSLTGGDEDADTTREYYYGWHIDDIRIDQTYNYRWTAYRSYPTTIGVQMGKDLYLVDETTGKVRNGETALAVDIDWTSVTSMGSKQMNVWFPEPIDVSEATSVGMWLYIPDYDTIKNTHTFRWCGYKQDGSIANLDTAFSVIEGSTCGFNDEGWVYVSCNALSNKLSTIEYFQIMANDASAAYHNPMAHYVFYIDDVTVDYSDAAIDRENPYFSGASISNGDQDVDLTNGYAVSENVVTLFAQANENMTKVNYTGLDLTSVKVTVDGQEITSGVSVTAGGRISVVDLELSDGIHTVRFEICDNQGNLGSITRKLVVGTGKSDVRFELADPNVTLPAAGSVVYVNLVADDIASIDSVVTKVRLDGVNEWDLEGMEVPYGFEASYTVNSNNDAVITITRVSEEIAEGTNVLAKLPVRVWMTSTYLNPEYIALGFVKDDPALQDKYYALTPYAMWLSDGVSIIRMILDASEGIVTYTDGTVDTFSSEEFNILTELNRYRNSKNNGDANFYQDKASFHIHTPGEATDKAATCLESGYTGRVFCVGCSCDTVKRYNHECDTHNGCGSVINWGTVIPAPGHNYVVTDGVLACEGCGKLFNGEKDGKTYIDGVVADGWINDTYYYIDGVMVTGQYYMDGTMYTFGTDGVYQPDFMFTDFYETVDGKLMYFVSNKPLTGYQSLMGKAYYFDADGYGYEGEYTMAGETCLFENGQFVSSSTANVINAGLAGNNATYAIYADGIFKLDGSGSTFSFSNHGTRPFIDYIGQIKTIQIGKDITRIATNFFAWTHVTKVEFSKVGKLEQLGTSAFLGCVYLREIELPATLTYMSTNSFGRCTNLTKVVVPASVTTISTKSFKDCSSYLTLYVIKDSYALEYAVANNIPYVVYEPETVKEIVEVDGVLYYVVDGVKTYGGLICLDGDYYYIRSNCQAVVNRSYWVTKTNDLLPEGNYTFGADGKMIDPPVVEPDEPDTPVEPEEPAEPSIPEAPGQIVDVNGVLYYRENGVNKYAGLIYLNGAIYYVRSNGQLAVNRTYWTTKHNDLLPAANYEFDAEGKMINPPIELPEADPDVPVEPEEPEVPTIPEATGTIVNENGVLYYYENGARKYAGLIYLDGNYYYVRSSAQLVVGRTYWVTKTNDLLPAANYEFDAEGKMINN